MDDLYSDKDMEAATGLPSIHVRRLITWGAVDPVKGGKGVVRKWDRSAIRHIACVNAFYVAGLSLPIAHTLAVLMPLRFVVNLIDRRYRRKITKNGQIDLQTAIEALDKEDIVVIIADGYSIFWKLGKRKPRFVGKLSTDRSVFLSVLDDYEYFECNPDSLSWEHQTELAEDPAQRMAAETLRHSVSMNTINLSLAVKLAMQHLLRLR